MFEFSRQADYAVRAVIELSLAPRGILIQSVDISERRDIPVKYLSTVIRNLVRAGIINTYRGSRGGIMLAEAPESITLRDVIEAVDGPLLLNRCLIQPGDCRLDDQHTCRLHEFWDSMAQNILEELEGTDFAQLSGGDRVY
jgi:Rrf2 family protein